MNTTPANQSTYWTLYRDCTHKLYNPLHQFLVVSLCYLSSDINSLRPLSLLPVHHVQELLSTIRCCCLLLLLMQTADIAHELDWTVMNRLPFSTVGSRQYRSLFSAQEKLAAGSNETTSPFKVQRPMIVIQRNMRSDRRLADLTACTHA